MRILYVEDNLTNQALVERVVRIKQHTVLFEEEGEDALELLAQDPDIDLVLLDIELAGTFSGIEVVKTLRERDDKRPIVAVTAYAMMGDRERILEAGCDQYLPKPLVISDLLAVMDHYEAALAPAPAAEAGAAVIPTPDKALVPTAEAGEPAAPTPEEAPAEVKAPAPAEPAPAAEAQEAPAAAPAASAPASAPAEAETPAPAVAAPDEASAPAKPTPAPPAETGTPTAPPGDGASAKSAAEPAKVTETPPVETVSAPAPVEQGADERITPSAPPGGSSS
ncbi:MAG: response regulator [Anaerolineae bacterium]|nr:response regulator [Anaerolineae bacterium]